MLQSAIAYNINVANTHSENGQHTGFWEDISFNYYISISDQVW